MNIRKTMIGLAAAASLAGVGGALADHFDDGQYPAF
jgi:hypothetical protein